MLFAAICRSCGAKLHQDGPMLPAKGPWPHPWYDDASHFLQVDAPERTVEQIVSFDADAARAR